MIAIGSSDFVPLTFEAARFVALAEARMTGHILGGYRGCQTRPDGLPAEVAENADRHFVWDSYPDPHAHPHPTKATASKLCATSVTFGYIWAWPESHRRRPQLRRGATSVTFGPVPASV